MAAMAGNTLAFNDRFMLDLLPDNFGFNLFMTIKTDLPGLVSEEIGLIGSVRAVAYYAFTIGKWRMGRFFFLFVEQFFMAC